MRKRRERYVHSAGYVMVKCPGHPRAHRYGFVYEHIIIAETVLGKHLPKGACIHHINGDPGDNRPENLVICQDVKYHNLLHRRARALAACGDPHALRCGICSKYDRQEDILGATKSSSWWHRSCAAERFQANYAADPDKYKQMARDYADKNRDKINARLRARREERRRRAA